MWERAGTARVGPKTRRTTWAMSWKPLYQNEEEGLVLCFNENTPTGEILIY